MSTQNAAQRRDSTNRQETGRYLRRPVGFRGGQEHRRLFQRLLADFERSVAAPPAKAPTLAEIVAEATEVRRAHEASG
jgi:hypothetical protein